MKDCLHHGPYRLGASQRPALLRYQLRALIEAGEGRPLRIMFPLVTTVEELDQARALVERELAWARSHGRSGPNQLEVGVMLTLSSESSLS